LTFLSNYYFNLGTFSSHNFIVFSDPEL